MSLMSAAFAKTTMPDNNEMHVTTGHSNDRQPGRK